MGVSECEVCFVVVRGWLLGVAVIVGKKGSSPSSSPLLFSPLPPFIAQGANTITVVNRKKRTKVRSCPHRSSCCHHVASTCCSSMWSASAAWGGGAHAQLLVVCGPMQTQLHA